LYWIEIPGRAASVGSSKGEEDKREQSEATSIAEAGMGSHEGDGTRRSVRK